MRISKNRIRILFIILLLSITAWLVISFFSPIWRGDIVPTKIAAYNDVLFIAMAINENYKQTGVVVDKLQELPDKSDSDFKDSWGNPVIYIKEKDGDIFLVGLGSDGKKGGSGVRMDTILNYNPENLESFHMGGDSIPETTNTRYKIRYLKEMILKYYKTNKKLPENLSDLKLNHDFFTNDDKDYWGNPIIYKVTEGHVMLISYGADQKKGDRFEGDLVVTFKVSGSIENK